jgi:hypothetical protein
MHFGGEFFVYDDRMIPEYMKGVSYRRAGIYRVSLDLSYSI